VATAIRVKFGIGIPIGGPPTCFNFSCFANPTQLKISKRKYLNSNEYFRHITFFEQQVAKLVINNQKSRSGFEKVINGPINRL